MPGTKQVRATPRPIPTPFRPSLGFPSLTTPAKDYVERVSDSVQETMRAMPRLVVDWFPDVSVVERREMFILTAELPGLTRDDIDVTFADGLLRLRGEKREVVERSAVRRYLTERPYGAFERTVALGGGIAFDRIIATLADGVLTVRVPKTEERKARRKAIPITG